MAAFLLGMKSLAEVMIPSFAPSKLSGRTGLTLVEVIVAMGLGGLLVGAITVGFIQCMRRAEWSSYSLAANSLAMQRLEQTRAAGWDSSNTTNDLVAANFPADRQVLDVSCDRTNIVYATNYTTISDISTNPPLKMIRVDCVWRFLNRGLFTNSIATYRSPET